MLCAKLSYSIKCIILLLHANNLIIIELHTNCNHYLLFASSRVLPFPILSHSSTVVLQNQRSQPDQPNKNTLGPHTPCRIRKGRQTRLQRPRRRRRRRDVRRWSRIRRDLTCDSNRSHLRLRQCNSLNDTRCFGSR
jgi:hypothetical protein